MYWSQEFIPTLKETPQEAETVSHKLMLRSGLVRMLVSGVYSYLPAGLRVLTNIENIIRQEMTACGASELLLPALQPLELWTKSGRDKDMGEVMIRFNDRRGRSLCLGPTHEEVITDLVKNHLSSYKQLPLVLYQIQTKFRDEIRPRFGLVRACEFVMKDAYSFDKDEAGLDKNYQAMYASYNKIFKRCGLDVLITEADSGVMGGNVSHEFMVPARDGEDVVLRCACGFIKGFKGEGKEACPRCSAEPQKVNCIEIGHIFKLGTKYSQSLGACFLDAQGKLRPVIMGCYGIGVSRLISAVIEQNHDEAGIVWPCEISPFKVIIIPLDVTEDRTMDASVALYRQLQQDSVEVLFDDRDERAGVKFKDADLLGVTLQVIIGKEFLKHETVEIKTRRSGQRLNVPLNAAAKQIKGLMDEKRPDHK